MRIALCLSGQPRTWRSTRESLMAFFAGHELDVFFHTWREGDPAELDAVVAAYAPRGHRIEERPLFVEEKRLMAERYPTLPPLTIIDMFYSAGESLALVAASGKTYDLVVRTRFDALFDGVWSQEVPPEGMVIVPDICPDTTGCTDQLAIGRPAEMQKYSGTGAWLLGVLPELARGPRGGYLRPEIVMLGYLEQICGLTVLRRDFAMKLLRDHQLGQPFAELVEDPLFHAQKHELWEAFAQEQFPEVAAQTSFDHAGRAALELDRALGTWLEAHPTKDGFQLLKAPWSRRIKAIDAFIVEQAGKLEQLDEPSYQNVRMLCAMVLQRMAPKEPMTLESFVVHALSANSDNMKRAADWGSAPGRLDKLAQTLKGLGPLGLAFSYTHPLRQKPIGIWRRI